MSKLILVIVHFEAPEEVNVLLESTRDWTMRPSKTLVIDNSSNYQVPAGAESVTLIRPGDNLGYAGAVNIALSEARGAGASRVLVCTQDARLDASALELMLNLMNRQPDCAVVAPLLAYASQPEVIFSAGGSLSKNGRCNHHLQGKKRNEVELPSETTSDWADGAVLLIDSTKSQNIGDFDPDFFLYVEEIDFQLRARKAGYTVRLALNATAYQEPGRYTDYLRYRNHYYFSNKHSDTLTHWPWRSVLLTDIAKFLLKGRAFDMLGALRGLRDARSGRMGRPA